jgi:hypothetical protein
MLDVVARACLMEILQTDGIRIALPVSNGEIDMLASIDSRATAGRWIPVRVIAGYSDTLPQFEHVRGPGLLVAVVLDFVNANAWRVHRAFALTPAELTVARMVALIARKGATRAVCTSDTGRTGKQILQNALEPFAILPGQWRKKFITLLKDHTLSRT